MHLESSVQLKEERTTLDTEDKCSVPEATSPSQVRSRNKLVGTKQKVAHAISRVEGTTSRKSKLGRDSTNDNNTIFEAEQQPHSATKAWKRKRKSLVPEVIIYAFYSINIVNLLDLSLFISCTDVKLMGWFDDRSQLFLNPNLDGTQQLRLIPTLGQSNSLHLPPKHGKGSGRLWYERIIIFLI